MQCKYRSMLMSPLISDNTHKPVTENSSNIYYLRKEKAEAFVIIMKSNLSFYLPELLTGFRLKFQSGWATSILFRISLLIHYA